MLKLFGAPAMPTVETPSVFFGLCFPLHEAAIAPPIGDHIEVPGNLELEQQPRITKNFPTHNPSRLELVGFMQVKPAGARVV